MIHSQPTTSRAALLLAKLTAQVHLLEQLIAIGQRQYDAIEGGLMAELMWLLAQKQPLLEQLESNNRAMGDDSSASSDLRDWPDSAARQTCLELRKKAEDQFQQLLELEQRCERSLTLSRDAISGRLAENHTASMVAMAYGSVSDGGVRGGTIDFSSK